MIDAVWGDSHSTAHDPVAFSSENMHIQPKFRPDSDGRVTVLPRGSQDDSRALSVVVAQSCPIFCPDTDPRFLSRTEGTEKTNGPGGRYAVTTWRGKFPAIKQVLRTRELSALRSPTVTSAWAWLGSSRPHSTVILVSPYFLTSAAGHGGVSRHSRTLYSRQYAFIKYFSAGMSQTSPRPFSIII